MSLVILEIMPDGAHTFHVKGDRRGLGWDYYVRAAKEYPYFYQGPIEISESRIHRWKMAEKSAEKFYKEISSLFQKEE